MAALMLAGVGFAWLTAYAIDATERAKEQAGCISRGAFFMRSASVTCWSWSVAPRNRTSMPK